MDTITSPRPGLQWPLAALLAGCAATLPAPPPVVPATTDFETAPATRVPAPIGRALRNALGPEAEARAFIAAADLDRDGEREYVAYVAGPDLCGTGGCSLFVLDERDGLWRTIALVTVVRVPVQLGPDDDAAWHPLLARVGGGGMQSATVALRWSDAGYPGNATTAEVVANPGAEAPMLVPEFDSYLHGSPLPATADTARVLGRGVAEEGIDSLREAVLSPLFDAFARSAGIAATDAEIDAWIDAIDRARDADLRSREAHQAEIARRLAQADVSAAEREALVAEHAQNRTFIAELGEPASGDAEARAVRADVARAFILQWKTHRALYARYGGRVAGQQGGPEPIDAVRAFLQERRGAGEFEIADPVLEEAFWSYWLDDSRHDFLSPDDASRAFATPPWAAIARP